MSLVRFRPKAPFAGLAHLVERHLAKVEVASSSLVTRSNEKRPLFINASFAIYICIWARRHSQAVRQESAKLSFPGPIPGGASKRSLVNQHLADLQGFFFFVVGCMGDFCFPFV